MDILTRVNQKCTTFPFPTMSKCHHPKMNPKHRTTMNKWTTTYSGMITTLKSKNASGLCKNSEFAFYVIYVIYDIYVMLFYSHLQDICIANCFRTGFWAPGFSRARTQTGLGIWRGRRASGNFSWGQGSTCLFSESTCSQIIRWQCPSPSYFKPFDSFLLIRTGSSACRATSSWTQSHFIRTHTLVQRMRMKMLTSQKTYVRKVWVLNSKSRTQFVGVGLKTPLTEM